MAKEYFLEFIGANIEATPRSWTVYPCDSDDNPILTSGQTITIAGSFTGRFRNTTPFVPNSLTGFYMVGSPATASGNDSIAYRLRVVAVQSLSTKTVSEFQLSNGDGVTGLDQTIGGGDMFRSTSWGLPDTETGFVSVGGPRFSYDSSAWSNVTRITFWGLLANASVDTTTRWSEVALYDISNSQYPVRITMDRTDMFLRARPWSESFPSSLLTTGHIYECRIRSVKTSAAFGDFNTYFHKARLTFHLSPMESYEFNLRCGNAAVPAVAETRGRHSGGYIPTPSVHFHAWGSTGTTPTLTDYGTSDTATSGTNVTGGQAPLTDTTTRQYRTVNLTSYISAGNRFASSANLQAAIVYKYPAIAEPAGPPDMAAREDYLDYLTAQGFTPNRAVLFTEGTGNPVEFYTVASLTPGGSPGWAINLTYGNAGYCDAIADFWRIEGSGNPLSTTAQTVLVVRRKIDTTLRNVFTFAVDSPTPNTLCAARVPNDINVVRWGYGDSANELLTWSGYTATADVEAWAFKAGAAGMSIWLNGTKVEFHTNSVSGTRANDGNDILINQGFSVNGDIQEFYFFALVPAQVSDAVLATFTPANVLLGF